MMTESKNWTEFKKWYENYEARHGYMSISKHIYDTTEKAHKDIRKLIGGKSISKKIKLEAGTCFDYYSNADHKYLYVDTILNILPKYLKEYKLTRDDLLKSTIGKVKTSKHILTYGRKYLNKRFAIDYDTQYYVSTLERQVSNLEYQKSRCNIREHNLEIHLLTTLEAFVSLGTYGPDDGSCFHNESSNKHCKLNLARVTDSFIILIVKNGKTVCRCWGRYDKEDGYFVLSNFYVLTLTSEEAKEACRQFLQSFIKEKLYVVGEAELDSQTNVFLNEDDVTFSINKDFADNPVLCLFDGKDVSPYDREPEYAY